ncbi:MAG: hypothetical protein PHY23_04795 [Oscillospiraceae bacterium]|nr:hypothetical protein [Oscillospiraceae bacterium]
MPYANWRSMDDETAMRGVHPDMTRKELIEVAYHARSGVARRIAVVYLDDPEITRAFALEDRDPMVRRGLARRLTDAKSLERLLEDADSSVRKAAAGTLRKLQEK